MSDSETFGGAGGDKAKLRRRAGGALLGIPGGLVSVGRKHPRIALGVAAAIAIPTGVWQVKDHDASSVVKNGSNGMENDFFAAAKPGTEKVTKCQDRIVQLLAGTKYYLGPGELTSTYTLPKIAKVTKTNLAGTVGPNQVVTMRGPVEYSPHKEWIGYRPDGMSNSVNDHVWVNTKQPTTNMKSYALPNATAGPLTIEACSIGTDGQATIAGHPVAEGLTTNTAQAKTLLDLMRVGPELHPGR